MGGVIAELVSVPRKYPIWATLLPCLAVLGRVVSLFRCCALFASMIFHIALLSTFVFRCISFIAALPPKKS